jgi:acyl dehydratase
VAGPEDIGRDLGPASFRVDASKVRELARSLYDDDPVYADEDAARAAGFAGIPVPLTASVLAAHRSEHGAVAAALALGLDLARLLHGESSWEYLRPLRVGDELAGRLVVEDVTRKEGSRGGAMTLVTTLTEFRDRAGEPVLRRRDTMIERGA